MEFIVDPAAQWSIFGVVQKFLTLSGTFAQPLPLLQLPEHLLIIVEVFANNLGSSSPNSFVILDFGLCLQKAYI